VTPIDTETADLQRTSLTSGSDAELRTFAERRKVRFPSGDATCAAWHYPGTNGACVIMAGGTAVTKEPGTDRFAKRFHEAGFTVLAFDFRRLGESGGQPRQIVRVGEQLADWQAAVGFAGTLPGVDPARLAIWGFSLSGGHVFRVASRQPDLAAAIAQAPLADGQAAAPNAMRHMTPLAALRLTGRGLLDAIGGLFGREPLLVALAGPRGTVASLTTPDGARGAEALNPDNKYPDWQQEVAARSALRLGFYRPGRSASRVRCPLLVLAYDDDRSALPGPPPARRSEPLAASSSACPVGTTRAFWAATSRPSTSSCPSCVDTCSTAAAMTHEIELSAGTIEYQDTGGEGPAIVLLPGLMMDASLWRDVISDLSPDQPCIAPTLPMGAHRHAMHADADLSPRGLAGLVSELLDRLDLNDVTLVGNDTGGALVQLLACDGAARVGRIVLVSCDAFDNFPPGLTGKTLVLTGKLSPTMFGLFMQQMRLRPLRRLPLAFGWLTMRGDAATARWIKPVLKQRKIRRDTVRVLAGSRHNASSCSMRPNACQLRAPRPRRLGEPKTASCRPSTDAVSPNSSRKDGWSRYPTATHSSP
jgi:pimeloyl-ACP methyl ester carboxylesterase